MCDLHVCYLQTIFRISLLHALNEVKEIEPTKYNKQKGKKIIKSGKQLDFHLFFLVIKAGFVLFVFLKETHVFIYFVNFVLMHVIYFLHCVRARISRFLICLALKILTHLLSARSLHSLISLKQLS